MTRKECLDKAMGCVLRDRNSTYGKPEDCFETIAMMWSAYLGKIIQGWDVATMMALLKIARIKANPAHADNWCDLAGYAACGAECRQKFEAEMKKTVEDAFETFPHLKPEAEGNCFQNGNGSPKFKPGDPVEWFSFGRKDAEADGWHPAFYLCKAGDPDYHVVQDIDGIYHVVNYANIRSPEAMYRPGDKVEALSFDGSRWEDAVVERTEVASGQWHCTVRLASGERHCLPVAGSIRRPSRAGDKAGGNHPENPDSSPDFKPGDKVQFCQFPHADVWFDGIVERVEECHCFIRRSNGVEVSAPKRLIRRPCAEGCEKPKFKAGDKVQIRVTLPSVSDRIWVDGTYARYDRGCAFPHAVYNDAGHEENVQEEDIRPAPKAEGVEDLVQKDAPQTPEEVCRRIVDSNPANYKPRNLWEGLTRLNIKPTFEPHKATGEELAEMAEEDEKHG